MRSNIFISIFFLILILECNALSYQDNLFRKIAEKNEGQNIMFSPLSLYQFLSLLSNGASGDTQKEILKVLFPEKEMDINKINENVNDIISTIESENEKNSNSICLEGDCQIHFNDVNGIFTRKGVELTDQFKTICDNYNTSFYELISAEQVNNFCSENTNGKIDHILDNIDSSLVLLLVNAIYFKGAWNDKFSQEDTEKRKFINYDKTKVNVDTMYQKYRSNLYYKDNKVQIISLPYVSNNIGFSMIIILPNLDKYSSPLDYLKKEKISLSEIDSKLKTKYNIHLYLPKFKYEFTQGLNPILNDLGMKLAFSENGANFENLCNNVDTYVNSIFQKTYIDVNENGTEAAAVTAGLIYSTSENKHNEEYYMNVDHSFIYMIKSNKIKDADDKYLMPFIGIVNKLEGENIDNDDDDIPIFGHDNGYILKNNLFGFISLIVLMLFS